MRNHTERISKTFQGIFTIIQFPYFFIYYKLSSFPVKNVDRNRKRIPTAKPIHVRRVEKALDLKLFLNSWESHQHISSSESDGEDVPNLNDVNIESILRGA